MSSGWKRRFVSTAVGAVAPCILPLAQPGALRVLNYHRINYSPPDFLLDPDVISATPELFARQISFCRRHFDVMSFADLSGIVRGLVRMPPRPLIITFDDGYEDNYRLAFPILRQHGLPATFFLAADYIGTDRLFWWDAVAFALQVLDGDRLEVRAAGGFHVFDTGSSGARRRSTKRLLRLLKTVTDGERRRIVEEVGDRVSGREHCLPRQIMKWAEARQMVEKGMEIGSHTNSHPVLSQVTEDAVLEHEIAGSKRRIEDRIGAPVSVLSYPVGGPTAFDGRVKAAAQRAGYEFAVTYVNGFNRMKPQTDHYALHRLHLDGLTEAEFRMRLVAPRL